MNITEPIRSHARTEPDAVAVIRSDGASVGYGAFDRTIDAVARRMIEAGVGPGDFVAAGSLGEYADLVIRLALARLGAAAAPATLSPLRTKLRIVRNADDLARHPDAKVVESRWFDPPPEDITPVPAFADAAAIMGLFASSGTTGRARLMQVTHDMMATRVTSANDAIPLAAPVRQVTVPSAQSGFGFTSRLRVLWSGGTLVSAPARPQDIVDLARRHEVDHLVLLPFWVPHLVAALPAGERPLPSLACIEFGGSALPAPALEAAQERLCAELWNIYGATEGGYVATGRFGTLDHDAGEAGYPVPGVEVRAFDAGGTPLAPGVEGFLRMRGRAFVHGYLDDPEHSAEAFRDGWFEPGDLGSVSAAGVVRVGGRESHLLNVGGYKLNPSVVERALASFDWVRDVSVFGVEDEHGLTQIAAAVVPARRIEPRDVEAMRVHRVPMPTVLIAVPALPRNENGKVRRDELVAMAIAHRRKQPAR